MASICLCSSRIWAFGCAGASGFVYGGPDMGSLVSSCPALGSAACARAFSFRPPHCNAHEQVSSTSWALVRGLPQHLPLHSPSKFLEGLPVLKATVCAGAKESKRRHACLRAC